MNNSCFYLGQRRRSVLRRVGASLAIGGGLAAAMLLPSQALAQASVRTGTIASVFLSNGSNYAFRVSLRQNGADPLSDCQADFAYVNTSNDNYQAYVAQLMTAYARGTPVRLEVAPDANGFCQLLEFGA